MAEDQGGVRGRAAGDQLVALEEHHSLHAAVGVLECGSLCIADAVCPPLDLVATHRSGCDGYTGTELSGRGHWCQRPFVEPAALLEPRGQLQLVTHVLYVGLADRES